MATDYTGLAEDFIGQTIRIFVPAVGIVEGTVEAVTTGSPLGAAKIFVPGIGMLEGVVGAGSDVWQVTGGVAGEYVANAAWSVGTLMAIAAAVLLLGIWVVEKK